MSAINLTSSRLTRLWRIACLLLHLLAGLLTVALCFPWSTPLQRDRHVKHWSGRLLRILEIRVQTSGHVPHYRTNGAMFIANHISWLDVFALNQIRAVRFVAKADVRNWPIAGWLAAQAGTLFIERGKRQDTGRVANDATDILARGGCLCYFPEGTTTSGNQLLPFKGSLLQAAINANAKVWPLAIRYPQPDGSNNLSLAFIGEDTLLESLMKILGQQQSVVELHFGEPKLASERSRRELSEELRQVIAALLHLPVREAPETVSGLPI